MKAPYLKEIRKKIQYLKSDEVKNRLYWSSIDIKYFLFCIFC